MKTFGTTLNQKRDIMKYTNWVLSWRRNGNVGITDGTNHVTLTESEWNQILIQRELDIEMSGGYPEE